MERPVGYPSPSKAPAGKLDRKTVERNRRILMDHLLQNLFSLVPSQHHFHPNFKEGLALPERVEQATSYVKQLRDRVERLQERKAKAVATLGGGDDDEDSMLKVMDLGNDCLEVILVTGEGFPVSEVVRVLEEGGAEVVGVNMARVGDHKVYHTLHAKVKIPGVGVDTPRIAGSIHELISEYSTQPSAYTCLPLI